MKQYIEREALIQQMADNFRQGVFEGCDCGEYRIAEYTICEAPVADVVEVKRGRWILKDENGNGVCSNCHRQDKIDPLATHCRYCGADMRGDGDG